MNTVITIFRKEMRAYFHSPVALIFLAIFLIATLFIFFTYGRFFARNIADVRPLFEWLPILLVFLVSAITMRAWSEEQKMGTLELLMTLPLKTRHLVFGKILAGMVLVALALGLTLPLPITVAALGDLDWGPVIGGYVGALLLAAVYMTIGMCVGSRTDNQIVSLMVTMIICSLLYLVGSEAVVSFFSIETGEILRALGTGSRFESIERGVIDLRDLVYYASLSAFFIVLSIHFLELKRLDTAMADGRRRTRTHVLTVVFMGLNVLAANIWLAPVSAARADLTEEGLYSISSSTTKILSELSEPVVIEGYFSEKTHPLLAPLVPRIRDLLTEYEIRGGDRVTVKFADPNKDEELEEEINSQYNIRPVPFRISARHEESVVNSYFHLLIRQGDEYVVLSFDDLIEVQADENEVDVRLRNLEYDLTSSIKKVSQGFQTFEAMFAQMQDDARLTLFVTPGSLPEEYAQVPEQIKAVAAELTDASGGKLTFEEVDLTNNPAKQQEIMNLYGFRPMAVGLFSNDNFYLYLLLQVGDHLERIYLQGELSEAAVKTAVEAGIKRGTPGFLKTLAIFTERPVPPPQNPNIPPQFQPPPPQPDYRLIQETLADEFEVKRLDALDSHVPGDVDVLIIAKPGRMTDTQRYAVDQYLMRGGSVIVMAGAYDIKAEQGEVVAAPTDKNWLQMLETYGVQVEDSFVLDQRNARFPVPVNEKRGMFNLQRIKMMNYPFFPDIRQDSFNEGHVALSGLQNVVLNWASPIQLKDDLSDREAEVLLSSSDEAWTTSTTTILPESIEAADTTWLPSGATTSYPLAVTITGTFPSHFADKPSPFFGADEQAKPEGGAEGDRTGRTLKKSAPTARLVVVGSSAFASDLVARLGSQMGGGSVYRSNLQLVRNLVDWSLADTDLLQIRTTGAFARTLKPLEESERNTWEGFNYLFVLIALGVVVFIAVSRRRHSKSILKAGGQA